MFIVEYFKNPRSIGAIAPSSKCLASKIINNIDFKRAKCIIEYGPGTGIFTEMILARVSNDTIVLLVEINKEFYNMLKDLYGHKKNVIIINNTVENIDIIMRKYYIDRVDYIVSGLPFTSLPIELTRTILKKTSQIISQYKATFITFQYSLLKLDLFNEYFKEIEIKKVLMNLPPAYILRSRGE